MNSIYEYTPLNSLPDDTVRLLRVCPGHSGEKIRCLLSTAQLSLRPMFAALSYTWGTEPASKEIELNGKHFWIRRNLWQCLMQLRETTDSLVIWIDAICVNQEDVPERNQQVRFMNHIFKTAKPVFAWLGEDIGGVCASFRQDLDGAEQFRVRSCTGRAVLDAGLLLPKKVEPEMSHETNSFLPTTPTEVETVIRICHSIANLCRREYWRRIWIVQEILVAQRLFLCFGTHRVSWGKFSGCCDSLCKTFSCLDPYPDQSRLGDALLECHRAIFHGSILSLTVQKRNYTFGELSDHAPLALHELICTYGSKGCSDSRDTVYALLGLRKHSKRRFQLQADYGKSNADLFFDVILFEGLPNISFAKNLLAGLRLNAHELKQTCKLRKSDGFSSQMMCEATVQEVLYTKVEGTSASQIRYQLQFVLIKVVEDLISASRFWGSEKSCGNLAIAFTKGHNTVEIGDFVFRIQHSSVLLVCRYQRTVLKPVARLQIFMPELSTTKYEKHGSFLCKNLASAASVQQVDQSLIDETWNGIVEIGYGPDVLLEVMEYSIDDHHLLGEDSSEASSPISETG